MIDLLSIFKSSKEELFYADDYSVLLNGDCLKLLKKINRNSIDCIFADPPYFLSNGGITVSSGKQVIVNKAAWDEGYTFEMKHRFNRKWIKLCKRILKDDGTMWISGTFHNIYSVGFALEQEGFKILNNITWEKRNPPPNLACRTFAHSTETILWVKKNSKKAKHFFNYKLMKEMNDNKQMKDVWKGNLTPKNEKRFGKHPTQKPEYLLERILEASTLIDAICLDPFNGSGTTGVVAKRLGRQYIGIDNSVDYLEISKKRIKEESYGKEKF